MRSALLDDVDPVKDSIEQASMAKKHFDLGKHNIMSHSYIKGVDDVIEIDYVSDSEEYDNYDSVYMPKILKQEDVDSSHDESDDESVGCNPEEVFVEDMIKGDEDISPPQHTGGQVRTWTKQDYIPSFSIKSYLRPGGSTYHRWRALILLIPTRMIS